MRRWMRAPRSVACLVLVMLGAGASSSPAADVGGPLEKVAAAIESLRNLDPRTVPEAEQEAYSEGLDRTWSVLQKHSRLAKPAIREALAAEQTDSFFLIDLSQLLLVLDDSEATRTEVAGWIRKADPNIYPGGYFLVSMHLAARRCQPCLPAVVKMLELEELDTVIEEHALEVDLPTGLLFTVGLYGDGASQALADSLVSPSCVVRRNAAELIYWMLPVETPPALLQVALDDTCLEARAKAWRALGILGEPSLIDLVTRRLAADPAAPKEEKLAMIEGLLTRFYPSIRKPLEMLAADADAEVRGVASQELQTLGIREEKQAELIANAGSAVETGRAEALKVLNRASHKGFLEFDGSALDLEAALNPQDLTHLNEARASILRRGSDESLYEFKTLYLAATVLRQVLAQRSIAIDGGEAQGREGAVSVPPRR